MELTSVEACCNLLARGKLMTADEVRTIRQRWLSEGKPSGDVKQFLKWLVAQRRLSDYQAAVLARGRIESLFVDQYKILDRIGQGRMAGVYKATHQLGQVVALKILPPSKAKEPVTLARFKREARLRAEAEKHPNIVRTFQAGFANDLHFLVMEYLEGETLEEVLQRRKKLPPTEAVRLLHQALMGLQHVQEQGLVHRDLKPGNLMLVPAPLPGLPDNTQHATIKLLDIGLGRSLFDEDAAAGVDDPGLTTEGTILGTSDYLSPEQARDAHKVDIRTDIYSLGCVLYHCLAGQPPFPDSSRVRQLVRHATEKARPLKQVNPAVPDGLQQIVDYMMAKDLNQRYATPERAAQALQVFLTASEPAGTIDLEPRMREYLAWLDANVDVEPYLAEGVEQTPAAAAPVLTARPSGLKPAVVPAPVPVARPVPPPRAPVRPPAKSSPASRPRPAPEPDNGEDEEPSAKRTPPPKEAAQGGGLSRRDLVVFALGLGVGIMCSVCAGGLGWLISRMLSK